MRTKINNLKKTLSILLELGKVRITFFVAVSTSIGYILFSGEISSEMLLPTLGVFFLACGSSAINHYQEGDTDALMDRTKGRPIPSGRISAAHAVLFALVLTLTGSLIIYFSSNIIALILGWIAFIWYNLFYTPAKKKFALAVVPGSLIGAIPPVIGWVAAGGNLVDPQILALALFFFIWQVPHFWLLLLLHSKDYEKAGFPTLTKIFNEIQLRRITYVWIVALAISCLLIPLFNVSSNLITVILLLISGLWLVLETKNILFQYIERILIKKAFLNVNLFVLMVVMLLSCDKLILTQF